MPEVEIVYSGSCPLCGGDVTASRLLSGMPCEAHAEFHKPDVEGVFRPLGLSPNPQQVRWARLFLHGVSFIMVGPPGVGKTQAGLAFSLHVLSRGGKPLVIEPPDLVEEVRARFGGLEVCPPSELPEGRFDLIFADEVDLGRETVRQRVLERLGEGGQLIISSPIPLGRKRWVKALNLHESPHVQERSALIVVESPTKARVISGFFGKASVGRVEGVPFYTVSSPFGLLRVMATGGHFYELDIDRETFGAKLGNGLTVYFRPTRSVIGALRRLSLEADEVYVATDPDAEGEKIAWDVRAVVTPFNPNVKRITYHEVTKRAITEALSNPGDFDSNLLHAQLLRRVEDAWIGLPLSLEVQRAFGIKVLSAGRVQTPVLGWVIERFESNRRDRVELLSLTLENGFRLVFKAPRGTFQAVMESGWVEVAGVSEEVREVNPPPPHNTSSLLIEAAAFGIPSDEAMRLAQDLFERGFITYHRTDATTVSALGMHLAKEFLARKGMENLSKPRPWTSEGAHECIRPTRGMDAEEVGQEVEKGNLPPLSRRHLFLYGLIFNRFMASQMKAARVRYQDVKFVAGGTEVEVRLPIEVLERGFFEILPLKLSEFRFSPGRYRVAEFSKRVVGREPLYTEGDLVRLMRERGIGRPSTYALTIRKLRERGYVFRLGTGALVSTKLGKEVHSYLQERYSGLVSEERTKLLYQKMDEVERGEAKVGQVIEELRRELLGLQVKERNFST